MKHKIAKSREDIYAGIDLWNKENPEFFIRKNLIEQNIFAPFSGIDVVGMNFYDNNGLIAFGLIKYNKRKIKNYIDDRQGWISLFVVDSAKKLSDSTKMDIIKTLEDFLSKQGAKRIRYGGDIQNFLPGLPYSLLDNYLSYYKKLAYKKGSTEYDLFRNIEDFSYIKEVENEDKLSVGRVSKKQENELYSFLEDNFPGRWLYEAQNIACIPGGLRDYWLLWYNNKPVGFARSNSSDSSYQGPNVNWGDQLGDKYCGLGPLGIDSDYRKRGWGLYLISQIIEQLQKEGYKQMIIDWTGLVDYYKKLGFEPYKKYLTLEKIL